MSQPRIPRRDHFRAVTRELDHAGLTWRAEPGGKHNRIIVEVNGREEVEIISGSPSDRRAVKNAVGHIRRRIRQWKAEVAEVLPAIATSAQSQPIEEETVHHSTDMHRADKALVYRGTLVRDAGASLSLTDMWRAAGSPSGRAPNDWLSLSSTREFVGAVEASFNAGESGIKSKKGRNGGTWGHWQIGLAYAKYLSPDFHMWCNDVVRAHMEQRPAPVALPAEVLEFIRRTDGIVRMLAHKLTEDGKAIAELQAFLTDPSSAPVAAFDLAGTVTALQVVTMAGIPADHRVRGTSAVVTRHLKDFCLTRGFIARKAPENIDPSCRWRFPEDAAREWLFGKQCGAETVRAHVAKARAASARAKGQMAMELVKP